MPFAISCISPLAKTLLAPDSILVFGDGSHVTHIIHAICYGVVAPSYHTESMHGAGSPQAQKIMIERESDMESKQGLARNIAGIDKRENPLD